MMCKYYLSAPEGDTRLWKENISLLLQNLFEAFLVFSYKSEQNFSVSVAEQFGTTKSAELSEWSIGPILSA